jgi:hypothetical protein
MILKSITELFDDKTNNLILTAAYRMIKNTDDFYEEVTMDSFDDDYTKNQEVLDNVAFDEYVESLGGRFDEIAITIREQLPRVLTVLQADDAEMSITPINMNNPFCGLLNVITALYLVEVVCCFGDLERGFVEGYEIKEAITDKVITRLKSEVADDDYTSLHELFYSTDNKVLLNYIV